MTTKNNQITDQEKAIEQTTTVVEPQKTKEQIKQEKKAELKLKYDEIIADLKNPVKKAVRRRKTGEKLVAILRGFIFFGLSFIIVFPIFQEISLAFRDPLDLNNKLVNWIPENFSLFNVKISIILLNYWKALWNNVKVSTISTVCQLFATSLAGYALSRLKFKGSNIIFWLLMLTLIVPPQAVSLSRTFYLGSFDIFAFGNHPGLFEKLLGHTLKLKGTGKTIVFYITSLTGQGIRAALFIFLFRQFFRGIPVELEESAQIDGAGAFTRFRVITLPMLMPAFTIVFFLTLANCFKLLDQNVALTNGAFGTRLLALQILKTPADMSPPNYGQAQAQAVIFFVLVAIITLIQVNITKKKEVEL